MTKGDATKDIARRERERKEHGVQVVTGDDRHRAKGGISASALRSMGWVGLEPTTNALKGRLSIFISHLF